MGKDSKGEHRLKYTASVRLAKREDVPIARSFIYSLATHHDSECLMTEATLEKELFRQPPLDGLTIFMLELELPFQTPLSKEETRSSAEECPSTTGDDKSTSSKCSLKSGASFPILLPEVDDRDRQLFYSPVSKRRVVVGHMSVIPSYYSRIAMPALRVEDIYIRDACRRHGLGRILLGTVARIASMEGFGRLDWMVHADNHKATEFYMSMGAEVIQERRSVKLLEEGIEALAR